MIQKNVAGQGVYLYAHDTSADAPKTGDAANITATVSKDGGAPVATSTTNPTEIGGGVYYLGLAQAETNADRLAVVPVSATGNVALDPEIRETLDPAQFSTFDASTDEVDLGAVSGNAVTGPADLKADVSGLSTYDPTADIAEGTTTYQELQRVLLAFAAGITTGADGTSPAFRDQADSKDRIAATLDASGNRTAVTVDGS